MAYQIKRIGKKNPVFESLQKKYPELEFQRMLKIGWVFEAGKDTPQYRILLTQKGFEMLEKPKEKSIWREGIDFYTKGLSGLAPEGKQIEKRKGRKGKEDTYEEWMKESRKLLGM